MITMFSSLYFVQKEQQTEVTGYLKDVWCRDFAHGMKDVWLTVVCMIQSTTSLMLLCLYLLITLNYVVVLSVNFDKTIYFGESSVI